MIEDNLNIDYEMIKNKRIELNMLQDKLSELANISRSQIQRLETGASDSKISTVCKVCLILNIDLNDLIKK